MEKKRIMVLPSASEGSQAAEIKALRPLATQHQICWSKDLPAASDLSAIDVLVINVGAHPFFASKQEGSSCAVMDQLPELREGKIPVILTTDDCSIVTDEKLFRTTDIVHNCVFVRHTGEYKDMSIIPGQEILRAAVEAAVATRPARTSKAKLQGSDCLP